MFFAEELALRKRVERKVVLSQDGYYRYALGRTWDWHAKRLYVVMVNPSDATDEVDDPTVLRLMSFAQRWGYGGLGIVNLFALRSPDPKALDEHPYPVGPQNAAYLRHVIELAIDEDSRILCAWGNNGVRQQRDRQFTQTARYAGAQLICLGLTQHGHPKHPLARGEHRVPDDFAPIPFEPPWCGQVTIGAVTVPALSDGRPACLRCDGARRLSREERCAECHGTGEHPNPFGDRS